jgi:hypothetical protein
VDGAGQRDHGAHGIFDSRSHTRSQQLWMSHHPRLVSGLAAGAAIGAGLLVGRRGRPARPR